MGQYLTFDAAEYDHTKIWITDVTRTGNREEWGTSTYEERENEKWE